MCRLLLTLYGRDTRPASTINLALALVWGVAFGLSEVSLPTNIDPRMAQGLCVLIIALAPFVMFGTGRLRQVTKAFSLTVGALFHAIIANGFISIYPPFDMMLGISVLFTLLFSGAVFYTLKCEGLDGKFTDTR